jgi:hypothetical protein
MLSWLEGHVHVGANLGVPHMQANTGLYFRAGYFENYFKGLQIDVTPGLQVWFFCGGDLLLVNYNAVLQGGIINQEHVYTLDEIGPVLWHLNFGGALSWRSISIEIGQEVNSPSFPGAEWHRWAYVSVMAGF